MLATLDFTGSKHRATVFPRIIAGGNYSKEGRNYFKYCSWSLEIVPWFIFFYHPIKWKKLSHQINWTWVFQVFQICFPDYSQSLNHQWSVLLDQIPLQLDIYREGIKEREDNKRERGDYLRETIISTVSIKGGRLFKEIRYIGSLQFFL